MAKGFLKIKKNILQYICWIYFVWVFPIVTFARIQLEHKANSKYSYTSKDEET